MSSFNFSKNSSSSTPKNYTLASTLRKPKSFIFELIFGDYIERHVKKPSDDQIIEATDYVFMPGQIFGFAYKFSGHNFKKIHHCFVLSSLNEGDYGSIIPGINPGAKVLLHTNTATSSKKLLDILGKLSSGGISLSKLDDKVYKKLHDLVFTKLPVDYFIKGLMEVHK